jgi:uncharacterized membrane protein YuzA (DUF378 family)
MGLQSVCGVLTPFLGIYLPKLAIDQLTGKAPVYRVIVVLGGFTLLIAITNFINNFASSAKYWRYNFARMHHILKIFSKTLDCDYQNIESASGQTRHQKAMNSVSGGDGSGISRIIPAINSMMVGILGFLLYSGILGKLNAFIIIFLITTSLINYFTLSHARNYEHANKDSWQL